MKPTAARYAASLLLVVIVLVLRLALQPWLGLSVPYLQFFPALMLAAWLSGTGPGLFAVGLAGVASDFFFLRPIYSFAIDDTTDRVSLSLFVLVGLAIVWLFEKIRRSERAHEAGANAARGQARELARVTRRLSDVVANVPGVVYEAWGQPDAASQRIDFVSDHVRSMLGYEPEEWTATPNFWLSVVHPDDRARAGAEARAIFESGADGRSEFRWVRKDGTVVWVEAHSSVILGDQGQPIGMRGVTLDISSRRALEEERAALLQRAEQARSEAVNANRLKDDFLATLSHELRTPLNAILGYSRMLRQGAVDPDRQARAFAVIERNAASLTQMVGDVLDVSRIVGGKIRLNVQTVDLPVVVEEAVATIRNAADAKGVRLDVIVDPAAGPISGDPDRVQQVIWNLLSNAVRFTPKEGRVQLRLERVDSHVEIVVSDTGMGIAAEFLPHVFERFRQADSRFSREYGGLGLGLAIARDLVELHGGTIRAFSEGEGRGATLCVKLPLMIVQAQEETVERVHPAAEAPRPATPPLSLAGVRVLTVDDDVDALTLVRDVLERAGATVVMADGAESALQALSTAVPDVMITDLGMPRMDGFALLEAVRASANEAIRTVPVAALTAYARSEDRTRALRAGFQMHHAKPIDPAELVAAVSVLARRGGPSTMRQTATLYVDCRCFLGEGITWWGPRRALLWTDIEASRLWMYDAGGAHHWKLPTRLGSLAPCTSGALLLALEHGLFRAEWEPSAPEGLRLERLAEVEPDLPSTRANDGRTDRSGNFVFGTMNQAEGHPALGSFYQWSTRSGLRRLDLPRVGIANSICFSPDGETMYFCDSPRGRIMACRYDADSAAVSEVREFATLGPADGQPDGSIVDAQGYLWNAAWGAGVVRRYHPDGSVEREVSVSAKNPTCAVFGGDGLNELYITTARQDMSPAELERVPEAGSVYRAVIEGVRGLADSVFAD